MEVNTAPYFESQDAAGVHYSRVPTLHFPVDRQGRTSLMQDVTMYSRVALYDGVSDWGKGEKPLPSGFNRAAAWTPKCSAEAIHFRQGDHDLRLTGIEGIVRTAIFEHSEGNAAANSFGLQWTDHGRRGIFPEYYRQDGDKMAVVPDDMVPIETHLKTQAFERAGVGRPYASSPEDGWIHPGPAKGPFQAHLTDGSTITYSWYRFIDQPTLQHLNLSSEERNRLQSLVEQIHSKWQIGKNYMPPPAVGPSPPSTLRLL